MASDRKQFAIEKMKKSFDKLSIPEQLEFYEELGKHIHNNVQKEQDRLKKESDELKSYAETVLGQQ